MFPYFYKYTMRSSIRGYRLRRVHPKTIKANNLGDIPSVFFFLCLLFSFFFLSPIDILSPPQHSQSTSSHRRNDSVLRPKHLSQGGLLACGTTTGPEMILDVVILYFLWRNISRHPSMSSALGLTKDSQVLS
jgi:hypothetical protein